ncbi:MAG: hypothetical protein GY913_24210 [Proteobacteria bacterium]|nr:hypothetical protein [Pseudomonadota bacterium]MCP4920019.1 hypothetical protein [Pseudomonadota bacterium]
MTFIDTETRLGPLLAEDVLDSAALAAARSWAAAAAAAPCLAQRASSAAV